jgi:hypothetical protein
VKEISKKKSKTFEPFQYLKCEASKHDFNPFIIFSHRANWTLITHFTPLPKCTQNQTMDENFNSGKSLQTINFRTI